MTGGTKSWSARKPLIVGIAAVAILVGGFGTWASQANIAGAIIASGRIEVDRNRQVVQHPDGGVVAEIAVDEGATVEIGDVLIRLDPSLLSSELAIIEGQLWETTARRARLEAERDDAENIDFPSDLLAIAEERDAVSELIDGQRNLFAARAETVSRNVEQLGRRRLQIADQISGIDAQLVALSRQLELINEELRDQQDLFERGLAQVGRVLALQREQASLEGRVGELTANRAQAEGRITEIDIEILGLNAGRREEAITQLRDIQFREVELMERRRAVSERLERLEITAPVGGIVYGLSV
ncbi:MAG: biotin/lipoyl-binding protein, partial [Pseudomonadota bacterium]